VRSDFSTPAKLFVKLKQNAEFRMLFADHVQRHLFNDGALTPAKAAARWQARANEIYGAVVGESARWGDYRRKPPYTRDREWQRELQRLLTQYFPQRTGVLLNQFRAAGLYPATAAPSFNQHGGLIQASFALSMNAPAGTIFFTLDGTDPRLPGGAVSPTAQPFSAPLPLNETVWIQSRALNGTAWSALNEAEFISGTDPRDPGSGLKIESVAITSEAGRAVRLRFYAQAGKTYSVLCRDALEAGGWLKLADVAAEPLARWVDTADTNLNQRTSRYYQLVSPQQPQ
jgi:hypothetical protein